MWMKLQMYTDSEENKSKQNIVSATHLLMIISPLPQ